ncbi:MAG: carboxypeptidase regulatory-like domain-containing protein [Acidobacteriota bacterium]
MSALAARWIVPGLLFLGSLAVITASALATETPAPLRLEGWVTDPVGAPLPDATIGLRPTPTYPGEGVPLPSLNEASWTQRTTVTAEGAWSLEPPGPGLYDLRIEAPGRMPALRLRLAVAENRRLPVAQLPSIADFPVRVADRRGEPIAAAQLSISSTLPLSAAPSLGSPLISPAPGIGYFTASSPVSSGEDGWAWLRLPADLEAELRVQAFGYQPVRGAIPAQRSAERGQSVTLTPSAPRSFRPPAAAVGVRAFSPDGHPLLSRREEGVLLISPGDESFFLVDERGRHLKPATTGASGPSAQITELETSDLAQDRARRSRLLPPLEAPLIGGPQMAWIDCGPVHPWRRYSPRSIAGIPFDANLCVLHGPGLLPSSIPMEGSAAVKMARARARRAGSLEGVLVDPSGAPVPAATVVAELIQVNSRIELNPGAATSTDAEGNFRFPILEPERGYWIRVSLPDGRKAQERIGIPPAGAGPASLRLVLGGGAASPADAPVKPSGSGIRVTGRVLSLDELPVANASVRLLLAESTRTLSGPQQLRNSTEDALAETLSGSGGDFAIADIQPGSYDLEVRAAGYAPAMVRQVEVTAIQGASGGGGSGEGAAQDLGDVLLAPGAGLYGRVSDDQGEPLGEVAVCFREAAQLSALLTGPRRCSEPHTFTDGEGRFEILDLAERLPVDLRLDHPGYVGRALSGVIPGGEELEITLSSGGQISGQVLDATGQPLPQARVELRSGKGLNAAQQRLAAPSVSTATTGPDGEFQILDAPTGSFLLSALAHGFLPSEPLPLEVDPLRPVENLRIALEAGATLEGRVLRPSGERLTGATVKLSRASRDALGAISLRGTGYASVSDGSGFYQLQGLPRGTLEVEVEHREFAPFSRQITIQEGVQRQDLQLPSGAGVSGRAVDSQGQPVGGVSLTLSPVQGGRGISASSDAQGEFRFATVTEGEYTLRGEHPDYAASTLPQPVAVLGQPVRDLRLVMEAGGTLSGRVLGLDFEELANVQLLASRRGTGRPWSGAVDYEGQWRFERMPAGSWSVSAIATGGRMAAETVELAPGQGEASVDLVFGDGFRVTGSLVRRGEGIANVNIFLRGLDNRGGGLAKTDYQGRFRLEDVAPGRYQFVALDASRALRHVEEVSIEGDRELFIELNDIDLSVQVVDAATVAPIADAEIKLVPRTSANTIGLPPSGRTDSEGSYRYQGPMEGPFWLRVEAAGYATRELDLSPESANGQDLLVELEPSPGARLQVLSAGGARLSQAWITVLAPEGRALSSGPVSAEADGLLSLPSVPPGRWEVIVQADLRSPAATLGIEVPGSPQSIQLPTAGGLRIRVPALAGRRGGFLQLVDGEGRPYRFSASIGRLVDRFSLDEGSALLPNLPSGLWQLEVYHPDGDRWSSVVQVPPAATAEVNLQ